MPQDSSINAGADNLLDAHINALGENSKRVVEILERLSEYKLSVKDKKSLKRIKTELKNIDKRFDSLDTKESTYIRHQKEIENTEEEEDWFAF